MGKEGEANGKELSVAELRKRKLAELEAEDAAEEKQETEAARKKRLTDDGYVLLEGADALGPCKVARRDCPYLGSINRHLLDFDFEKMCSLTLSSNNVYVDLVDGKYFHGLGKHTPAYQHALQEQHYLWMNLDNGRVYCIPDGYEVYDASLQDIKKNLLPEFTPEQIKEMSTAVLYGKSLDGTDFLPGCVGLNSIKDSSYLSVVIQVLCQVIPLRNFLLTYKPLSSVKKPDPVLMHLAELIRKIHNPTSFKGVVSPHELLQAVSRYSKNQFFTQHHDPVALLSWLLNRVHAKTKTKPDEQGFESSVHKCFKGELILKTSQLREDEAVPVTESKQDYLILTCDLPPDPLFKDSMDFIPHVPLSLLLDKFNGESTHTNIHGEVKRYTLRRLPPYLLLHINRFSKNNFFTEKNPTIVTFPLKGLDIKEFLHPDAQRMNPETRYDLVSNVVHEGKAEGGKYKVFSHYNPLRQWNEIQDLRVSPVLPQTVALSESFLMVFQRLDVEPDGTFKVVDPATLEEEPEVFMPTEMEMAPDALAEAGIIIG